MKNLDVTQNFKKTISVGNSCPTILLRFSYLVELFLRREQRIGAIPKQNLLRAFSRKVSDALLREHAHVDLEAEKGEDGEREHGEDDDVLQVLHRLDHSAHDRFQAC